MLTLSPFVRIITMDNKKGDDASETVYIFMPGADFSALYFILFETGFVSGADSNGG